jgi:hypothetical protein
MSAFGRLGPGAVIRVVSQKEEEGRKYLLLEGKSRPVEGPSGKQVRVIRQWVDYDQAVAFLKGGLDGSDGLGGSGSKDGSASTANTMADEDADADADDGSSPFFGGSVRLM